MWARAVDAQDHHIGYRVLKLLGIRSLHAAYVSLLRSFAAQMCLVSISLPARVLQYPDHSSRACARPFWEIALQFGAFGSCQENNFAEMGAGQANLEHARLQQRLDDCMMNTRPWSVGV